MYLNKWYLQYGHNENIYIITSLGPMLYYSQYTTHGGNEYLYDVLEKNVKYVDMHGK